MSIAPIRFPGREKEPPFDVAPIRKIISDLLTQTADEVESDEIEIKGWCGNERELADKVAEACACLANTSGGYVIVGVADGPATRKFSMCPHPGVTTSWLQGSVHNLTRPPVECFPFDASGLLGEIIGCPSGNLYALRVPRTRYISGHLTHKGISKVRRGKECQPQYLAEDDRTNISVPQITVDDLSTTSIDWGIGQHQRHFKTSAAWADQTEFLSQARLLRTYLPDEEYLPEFQPSLAALLLFGKVAAIERTIPFFETVVITERERISIRKNVIESVRELCIGESSILRSRLPEVPADVLKELVVNAFIHRCYRTPGPILINVSADGLEVRSPGELLTGLCVTNLIHGVPVYRNLLLADGARFVGLCDKIGQGIDLIFQGVLSSGLGFPEFESGDNVFIARIPLAGSAEFREFIRKRSWPLNQLDEIIVLRILWGRETASLDDLCFGMQRRREFATRVLEQMCRKGMVEAIDGQYRLAAVVRHDIETIFQSNQLSFDRSMWG